jgi:chromate transporter
VNTNTDKVSLGAIAVTFARISSTALGGGQMGAIRREVVRAHKWVDDDTYLEILALGQLLPGSNPTSVAVMVGARLRGALGASVALAAMVLPGFAILMVLGAFALTSHAPWMTGALRACAATAVGLMLANTIEMSIKRINVVDVVLTVAVAAAVLVLHASLALTLAVFVPLALLLTRPAKVPA